MSWKQGPLPPDTWNWGGVSLFNNFGDPEDGFYFADFKGDHAVLVPDGKVVKPEEVAWWNNCLNLPPGNSTHRMGAK